MGWVGLWFALGALGVWVLFMFDDWVSGQRGVFFRNGLDHAGAIGLEL